MDRATHAFIYRRHHMADLGTLGGNNSQAWAINNRGDVVGQSGTVSGRTHAVLWRNGRIVDLGTLPGGTDSYARDINDNGDIVGYSTARATSSVHAFLYHRGRMTDLGSLRRGGYSTASGISNDGLISGSSTVDAMNSVSVVWRAGRLHVLRGLPYRYNETQAVSNRDAVVGYTAGGPVGNTSYLWKSDRMVFGVGADVRRAIRGVTFDQAQAVNTRGQVVGNTNFKGFVWASGERVVALPGLVGTNSAAYGINDAGVVVGVGSTSANSHAVMWTRR